MNLFAREKCAFKKMNLAVLLILFLLVLLHSEQSFAEKNAIAGNDTIQLGKVMQISFDPKEWFYYQPKAMAEAKVSVFEGQKLNSIHAYLHTDNYVIHAPVLDSLCKELAKLPLDPSSKNIGKSELIKIAGVDACKVTKNDGDQIAVQYVFVSRKDIKGRLPATLQQTRYYTHYLYFYFPKQSTNEAEPLVANLVRGIGRKK